MNYFSHGRPAGRAHRGSRPVHGRRLSDRRHGRRIACAHRRRRHEHLHLLEFRPHGATDERGAGGRRDHRAEFYGLVREPAQRAGLPMPRVYIMQNEQPNAFATGRNPQHAAVCASTGLLNMTPQPRCRRGSSAMCAGRAVADLCAAPGGKTAQLAHAGAHVTAVDRSTARLARLAENLARLRLAAETVTADAAEWQAGPFDAVLIDPPCLSTGTIRRHPDVPWLKHESDLAGLVSLQRRLLDHMAMLTKAGGTIIYCTCSARARGRGRGDRRPARARAAAAPPAHPRTRRGRRSCRIADPRRRPAHSPMPSPRS